MSTQARGCRYPDPFSWEPVIATLRTHFEASDAAFYLREGASAHRYAATVQAERRLAQSYLEQLLETAWARYGWTRTCTAHTGPIWKLGGESCGCTRPDGHDGVHVCTCGSWWHLGPPR